MRSLGIVALVLWVVGTQGCGGTEQPAESKPAAATAKLAVPHPDLKSVEVAARAQIEGRRGALETELAAGSTPEALARHFGELGQLYHAYGFTAAASACYLEAAQRAPGEPRWPYLAAVLAQEAGRVEEARAQLERTATLAPGEGAVRLRLGQLLLDAHRPEEARQAYLAAQAAGAAFELPARLGLGRVSAALGDRAAAKAELQAVVKAAPSSGQARYALALVLRDLGEAEEAKRLLAMPSAGELSFPDPWLEEATSVAQGSGAAMRQGGEALMAGRLPEAEAAFRQAVAVAPTYMEARRNLALSLSRQGKAKEAEAVLAEAAQLSPQDAGVQFDWGNALLASGDREGAILRFERALALAPDYHAARFNLANTLIALGRWQPAMGHLSTLSAANPADPKPRYLLAMGLAQRGDLAEAERRLRELLAEDGGNVPALEGLGQVLLASRKLEAALEAFESALRHGAGVAGWTGLAAALSQSGQHAKAKSRLEQGLREKAGDATIEMALTLSLARLLATCPDEKVRDGRAALELAERAMKAQPSVASAETWAQALAASGEVAKAAEVQKALLARVQQAGDLATARRLAADLAQYLAGKAIVRPLG